MNARQWRQRALFGALAMTIVWSAVSGKGNSTADKQVAAAGTALPPAPRPPARPVPRLELEPLRNEDAPAAAEPATGNPFGAMSWHVPPPPPPPKAVVQPPPPPPPSAPPVPFTFMGRYEEGGVRIILLVRDDRIYTVSEGDVIDKTYRIERLAGGQLELTYLPLGTRQTINTGGT
jgi:hypothetical protein